MIYRILCNGSDGNIFFEVLWNKTATATAARERLMGASAANVSSGWGTLPVPSITNRRARFYFKEKGWREVGRFVAAAARRDGRIVRVRQRKNPAPSEIVYEDEWQVALLPRRGVPRKKRK